MVYGHIHGQVPVLQLDSEGHAILLHESNCLIGATARTWHNHSDQNEWTKLLKSRIDFLSLFLYSLKGFAVNKESIWRLTAFPLENPHWSQQVSREWDLA